MAAICDSDVLVYKVLSTMIGVDSWLNGADALIPVARTS